MPPCFVISPWYSSVFCQYSCPGSISESEPCTNGTEMRSEASVQTDQPEVNLREGAECAEAVRSAETVALPLDVTDLDCGSLISTTSDSRSCTTVRVDEVDAGEVPVATNTANMGPRSAGLESNATIQSLGDCDSEHLIGVLRMTNLLQLIQLDS
eukprot:122274-Hanusia_phi.AAC.1